MHRKRFITNTVFLFGTGIIAQVVGLFVLPLFIKNLGKEMYGTKQKNITPNAVLSIEISPERK